MQQQRIEEIESKTRDILTKILDDFDNLEPPINLAKILNHYDLSLKLAKFQDDSIGGALDKDKKAIYIAADESAKRQAFTVAHELGHFILGHKKYDVFYRHQANEFDGEDTQYEKEANWFAASLLMPRELVKKFWVKDKNVELMAAYFGVSKSAAYWRLKNLNMI